MAIRELIVEGYRSLQDLWLKLRPVNVIIGPNGAGKTNIYRSLQLLQACAEGNLGTFLAAEGGMPSVLFAGPRKKGPVRMRVQVKVDNLCYELILGLVVPGTSPFELDPDVKEENVSWLEDGKKTVLAERRGQRVTARDGKGRLVTYPHAVMANESVLAELQEPELFPELFVLRQTFLNWRFYHGFNTAAGSPVRQPQFATFTPKLNHDGNDLAATLRSIQFMGNGDLVQEALNAAFPGAHMNTETKGGRIALHMQMPGMERAFDARELSDGTLQYLCLVAALLSPRPPAFIALNEPEASIHPDLLQPLSGLISQASLDSQIFLVTHSRELADHILEAAGQEPTELAKRDGKTYIVGQKLAADD